MYDIEIENITDMETRECIGIFNAELNSLLNTTHECSSVEIGKYVKTGQDDSAAINMEFTRQGKTAVLVFKADYFEDYCYSTRKERNILLKTTLEEIKDKIATL